MEAGASAKKAHEESMNKLYYGDNLQILRECIASESIDLVYTSIIAYVTGVQAARELLSHPRPSRTRTA